MSEYATIFEPNSICWHSAQAPKTKVNVKMNMLMKEKILYSKPKFTEILC